MGKSRKENMYIYLVGGIAQQPLQAFIEDPTWQDRALASDGTA